MAGNNRLYYITGSAVLAVLIGIDAYVLTHDLDSFVLVPGPDPVPEAIALSHSVDVSFTYDMAETYYDRFDGSFAVVHEDVIWSPNHCEFCTRVEYVPGPDDKAGFSYEDVAGLDLSGAKKVKFWVMGEEGNEKIKFKVAGKSLDKIQNRLDKLESKLDSIFESERFALTTQEVTLDDDWKKYEVDVSGVDLKGITHPFAFELSENGAEKQVLYIKGVVYDDEPVEDALAIEEPEEEILDEPQAVPEEETDEQAPNQTSYSNETSENAGLTANLNVE